MDDLLIEVDRALRARGWSARRASIEAAGNPDYLRNMRRGSVATIERFRTLCEVLGLEFYVGAPRETGSVDRNRLLAALEATDRVLSEEAIPRELDLSDKARMVAAVYELLGDVAMAPDSPLVINRIRRLIQAAMGLARWLPEPTHR